MREKIKKMVEGYARKASSKQCAATHCITHTADALFRVGKPQPLALRAVCMAGKAAAVARIFATVCIVRTRLYLVRAVYMHTLVT